jgi:CIC family chloride channel protein
MVLLFVGLTMLVKVFATGITLGSGGNGGNFAPSLFMGSYLGFFIAKFFNLLGFDKTLSVSNFTLVGMAGILSGLFHAPLTAIFLIAEITGGYNLMVPLMIVSSVSYAISKQFEPYSFDIKHLVDKGEAYTNDKDRNILNTLEISDFITVDHKVVYESDNLLNFIEVLQQTDESIFPVFDSENKFIGLIDSNSIRPLLFSAFKIKYTSTKEITNPPKEIISVTDTVDVVIRKFEKTQTTILPVFKKDIFVGFVYKSMILERYREQLKEMIIE